MEVNVHPVSDEELMAYLDGELPAAQSLDVAAHLERCGSCQALAAEFRGLSRRLGEWTVEPAPEELFQRLVWERASERSAVQWLTGLLRRRVALAVLAGIPLLLLILVSRSSRPLPEQMRVESRLMTTPAERSYRAEYGDALSKNQEAKDQELPSQGGPKIVRSAQLSFIASNFDTVRTDIERALRAHKGYIGQLNINTPADRSRSLEASLRVPSGELDAVLADLRKLGRLTNESQGGEDVSQRYVDIEARLANARNTEQRLTQLLRERTGKLSDVLAAEAQIARVREQIEVTEAEQKNLSNQIALATIQLRATEEYRQPLAVQDGSALANLRNAGVQGIRNVASGVLAVALWLLSVGPSLLLIAAILFFPVRWAWRKSRLT